MPETFADLMRAVGIRSAWEDVAPTLPRRAPPASPRPMPRQMRYRENPALADQYERDASGGHEAQSMPDTTPWPGERMAPGNARGAARAAWGVADFLTPLPSAYRAGFAAADGDTEGALINGGMAALGAHGWGEAMAGRPAAALPRRAPVATGEPSAAPRPPSMSREQATPEQVTAHVNDTARLWVESMGGGQEGEQSAVGVLRNQLNGTHGFLRQDIESQIAAVQSGAYRQGERNTWSGRVEDAFPELYAPPAELPRSRAPQAPDAGGAGGERLPSEAPTVTPTTTRIERLHGNRTYESANTVVNIDKTPGVPWHEVRWGVRDNRVPAGLVDRARIEQEGIRAALDAIKRDAATRGAGIQYYLTGATPALTRRYGRLAEQLAQEAGFTARIIDSGESSGMVLSRAKPTRSPEPSPARSDAGGGRYRAESAGGEPANFNRDPESLDARLGLPEAPGEYASTGWATGVTQGNENALYVWAHDRAGNRGGNPLDGPFETVEDAQRAASQIRAQGRWEHVSVGRPTPHTPNGGDGGKPRTSKRLRRIDRGLSALGNETRH